MMLFALLLSFVLAGKDFVTEKISVGMEVESSGDIKLMFAKKGVPIPWLYWTDGKTGGNTKVDLDKGDAFGHTVGSINEWPYIKATPDLPLERGEVMLEYVLAPFPVDDPDFHTAAQIALATMSGTLKAVCDAGGASVVNVASYTSRDAGAEAIYDMEIRGVAEAEIIAYIKETLMLDDEGTANSEAYYKSSIKAKLKGKANRGIWYATWMAAYNAKVTDDLFAGLKPGGVDFVKADWMLGAETEGKHRTFLHCEEGAALGFAQNIHVSFGLLLSQFMTTIVREESGSTHAASAEMWATYYVSNNEQLSPQEDNAELNSLFFLFFWDIYVHAYAQKHNLEGSNVKNAFGMLPRVTVASFIRAMNVDARRAVEAWRDADGYDTIKALDMCKNPVTGNVCNTCFGIGDPETYTPWTQNQIKDNLAAFSYKPEYQGESQEKFGFGTYENRMRDDFGAFKVDTAQIQGTTALQTCVVVEHRTNIYKALIPDMVSPKDMKKSPQKEWLARYKWFNEQVGPDPALALVAAAAELERQREENKKNFGGNDCNPFAAALQKKAKKRLKKAKKKAKAKPKPKPAAKAAKDGPGIDESSIAGAFDEPKLAESASEQLQIAESADEKVEIAASFRDDRNTILAGVSLIAAGLFVTAVYLRSRSKQTDYFPLGDLEDEI